MKPNPQTPRRPSIDLTQLNTPALPKASEPDPAAPAPKNASTTSRASTASNASSASNAGKASTRTPRRATRRSVTIRLPEELAARARTAFRAQAGDFTNEDSAPTFDAWATLIFEHAVTEAEHRYNNGNPFPPTPPGTLATGHPRIGH